MLCDRYIDSSIAYQGAGRTLPTAEVARLSEWATGRLLPDLTVLLDIDPDERAGPGRQKPAAASTGWSASSSTSTSGSGRLPRAGRGQIRIGTWCWTRPRPLDELAADIAGARC